MLKNSNINCQIQSLGFLIIVIYYKFSWYVSIEACTRSNFEMMQYILFQIQFYKKRNKTNKAHELVIEFLHV